MKKLLSMLLLFPMLSLLAGCGKMGEVQKDDGYSVVVSGGEIKIGIIAPLTGAVSVYGTSALNAIELAVSEINRSKDILPGYKIKLLKLDDQGDATVGAAAFKTALSSGAAAIIGSVTTSVTAAITSLANEHEVLMITPSATGDDITKESDFVFRACFKDSFQGALAARYAKELGYDEASILYAKGDAYSSGLRSAFVKECENLGIKISAQMTSPTISEETTFASQISTIVGKMGEDGFLFAPYYYDAVGPLIIPDVRKSGFKGVVMGCDGYDGMIPDYVTGDLSVYNNVYFTNHYSDESRDEKVVDFIKNYKEEFGETPTAFAALGYDAAYMLLLSLEKVLGETPDKVSGRALKKAMDNMSYKGVTGDMTLDETGTPEKKAVILEYWYNEDEGKVKSRGVSIPTD